MFTKAIEIDPGYALAYAGLADTYTEFWRNYESTEENLTQAEEASREAVELDPNLAEAHASRGFALGQRRRYKDAEREFAVAVKLNPRLFEAYYHYGTVAFAAGELGSAMDALERSYEAGLADPDWMREDLDLDNVRDHPRYRALVDRMEASGSRLR